MMHVYPEHTYYDIHIHIDITSIPTQWMGSLKACICWAAVDLAQVSFRWSTSNLSSMKAWGREQQEWRSHPLHPLCHVLACFFVLLLSSKRLENQTVGSSRSGIPAQAGSVAFDGTGEQLKALSEALELLSAAIKVIDTPRILLCFGDLNVDYCPWQLDWPLG